MVVRFRNKEDVTERPAEPVEGLGSLRRAHEGGSPAEPRIDFEEIRAQVSEWLRNNPTATHRSRGLFSPEPTDAEIENIVDRLRGVDRGNILWESLSPKEREGLSRESYVSAVAALEDAVRHKFSGHR